MGDFPHFRGTSWSAPPPPSPALIPFRVSLPAVEAPPPSSQRTIAEDVIMFIAAALPVVLGFVPLIFYLITGSFQKTVKIFRTPAMTAGVLNSILWLFYCLIVQRVDESWSDVVTSNGFMLILNYSYLMVVYAHRRSVLQGVLLSMLVIPATILLFIAMRWRSVLPDKAQTYFGTLGLISLLISYGFQIYDICHSTSRYLESVITAINLVPSLVFNVAVGYVTWTIHPDQLFLWFSSCINSVCCFVGLVILVIKMVKDCCKRTEDDNEDPDAELGLLNRKNKNLNIGDPRFPETSATPPKTEEVQSESHKSVGSSSNGNIAGKRDLVSPVPTPASSACKVPGPTADEISHDSTSNGENLASSTGNIAGKRDLVSPVPTPASSACKVPGPTASLGEVSETLKSSKSLRSQYKKVTARTERSHRLESHAATVVTRPERLDRVVVVSPGNECFCLPRRRLDKQGPPVVIPGEERCIPRRRQRLLPRDQGLTV